MPNYLIPTMGLCIIGLYTKKRLLLNRIMSIVAVTLNAGMLLQLDCSTGRLAIAIFIILVIFNKGDSFEN